MKIYGHLNFSIAFISQFRASRYTMGLIHTPTSKVIPIWIWWELSCSISSISIYYAIQSDIRVKSYNHLNFSRAFVVHFRTSQYIMGITHAHESRFMVVWMDRELSCSLWSVSIYFALQSNIRLKVMINWISRELPLFIVERLDISWASIIHPSQQLWPVEFAESFPVEIRMSRYMMRLNHTPE